MSFYNRTTGQIRGTLPNHAGGVFGLARAYTAGNVSLPVGGWYAATITEATPGPHQKAVDGEWTFDDFAGTATMTKQAVNLTVAEAVQRIKQEAQRRINLLKGGDEPWRGENALSKAARLVRKEAAGTITPEETAALAALNAAGDEVDRLRAKSDELELAYASEPFDFTADSVWAA